MAEPDVSEQAGVREQAEDSEPPDEAGRLTAPTRRTGAAPN